MGAELLDRILTAYDLPPPVTLFALPGAGGINNTVVGVRAGAGEYVYKTYSTHGNPATILYEHRLLGWLAAAGLSFAVPVPLPARDGGTLGRAPGGGGWGALFPLLPGEQLDRRDPTLAEALGAALRELHAALARYPNEPRPGFPAYGDLARVHPRVPDPFALTPPQLGLPDAASYDRLLGWWRGELARLRPFIAGTYRALPYQVIHGDFGPGNALARAGRITALLDFDFAAPDARAMDLAQGLEFTMRRWESPEPLAMAGPFCRGYARRGRLSEAEVAAIPWLIRLRDATAAVWWLGRSLTAGDARPQVERLEEMRAAGRWLAENERRLVEIVGREVG